MFHFKLIICINNKITLCWYSLIKALIRTSKTFLSFNSTMKKKQNFKTYIFLHKLQGSILLKETKIFLITRLCISNNFKNRYLKIIPIFYCWLFYFTYIFYIYIIYYMYQKLVFSKSPRKIIYKKNRDLVGLVTSWVSSNNHNSFSLISSPCGAVINPKLTYKKLM